VYGLPWPVCPLLANYSLALGYSASRHSAEGRCHSLDHNPRR